MSISAIFKVLLSLIFSAQFFIDHLTLPFFITPGIIAEYGQRFSSAKPPQMRTASHGTRNVPYTGGDTDFLRPPPAFHSFPQLIRPGCRPEKSLL